MKDKQLHYTQGNKFGWPSLDIPSKALSVDVLKKTSQF